MRFAGPDELRGQVEENLRQLGRDHLDVVNLRVSQTESIAEHFGVLAELRKKGLIRHLGVSNIGPRHLVQAEEVAPVVCVQNPYGLGHRPAESEDLLRICVERGIAFVPFYAVAGEGRDSGARGADSDQILGVARAHGATAAQVRLAWTLRQGPHVLIIPGTGNPDHVTENVAAGALHLSDDDVAHLES